MLDEQRLDRQDLRDVDKVFVVACGTAYHAGLIGKHAIEHWTRVPVEVEMASEFRYRDPVLDRQTLVVAISQSGETADTLEAVRHARSQRAQGAVASATPTARRSRASPTPCSTRTPGRRSGSPRPRPSSPRSPRSSWWGSRSRRRAAPSTATRSAASIAALAGDAGADRRRRWRVVDPVRELAREIAPAKAVLFLGRAVGYPVALEGALKLKELAYMHAEGFPAGELKHGPIALIEDGLPVVVVMPSPIGRRVLHQKMLSNIAEIRARGARTIVIAEQGDEAVAPACGPPDRGAGGADPVRAARHHDPAAGARRRDRPGPRLRRRQAAQPGQVGHRRVVPPLFVDAASTCVDRVRMATMMTQYVMGMIGELRFQPTAKRIRVLADGETVADTTRAVLVWEPRRVTPQYAVPAADLQADLVDAPGTSRTPRRAS